MSPVVVRLTAFTVVLAGAFGTAYAVGEKLPGHNHGDVAHAHVDETGGLMAMTPSASGYRLVTDLDVGSGVVGFHLVDPVGIRVTSFTEAHGAQLHTVLTRPDLSGFQHIHPAIAGDGSWVVPITEPGPWHIVFDGVPAGAQSNVVVTADVDDGAAFTATPLAAASNSVQVDGLTVTLDRTATTMTFTVTPGDGLEPYLGQPAHLIALRQGDLAYQHLHPGDAMPGLFMFEGALETPGTYRLFLQFGDQGSVLTVPFTVVQS